MSKERQLRTVMYIGPKDRKYDSPNNNLNRVWTGTGTIVRDIPVVQSANLVAHPDEFIDVTSFNDEELKARAQKAIADCEERFRNARALGAAKKNGQGSGVLLEFATDEQIQEEIERRKERYNLSEQTVKEADVSEVTENLQETTEKQRSDQAFLNEKIPEAIEAVLSAGDTALLDDEGLPTKVAIEEELGFSITDHDYNQALDIPAPA